jgi:hypothetical protein
MEFTAVLGLVVGISFIGGLGYKLNAELSKIKTMLEVFMTKADYKWERLDEIEVRVRYLEKKVLMKEDVSQ